MTTKTTNDTKRQSIKTKDYRFIFHTAFDRCILAWWDTTLVKLCMYISGKQRSWLANSFKCLAIGSLFLSVANNGRVQQTQLLRSGSVSACCYWCILLDHPIVASDHGSAPQQLSLLNATNGCIQKRNRSLKAQW